MARILPTDTEKIEDLKSELIISLELQRGEGCDLSTVDDNVGRLAQAVRPLLDDGEGDSGRELFDDVYPAVESAYENWREIDGTLERTLHMAYGGAIPRSNLLLDQVRASLREQMGEPLAERYTGLRGRWRKHVGDKPWDAFMTAAPAHADQEALESSLGALVRGDDLDVEDALLELTRDLRPAFADHIDAHPSDIHDLEIGVWKRPEILIASEYWGPRRRSRLVDLFINRGSRRFADALRMLDRLFTPSKAGAAAVVAQLKETPEMYRERFTRCLMLHPDYEVRRYAVGNADINSMWKVVSPRSVPCATILSLLEHMAGGHYTTAQRRVFFDAIYRRLLSVTNRSDVLYARGIARILTKLDFFLEDDYFARLMTVLDYLAEKEKLFKIDDGLMTAYVSRLRREKDRVGSVPTEEPSFGGVPLVILRKLARDGHFWELMCTHPIVKIARETIAYINTPDRAYTLAENHRVNQEVIRAVGRRRELFSRLSARVALLANPKTPPTVSLDYVSDLTRRDVESLLRRSGLHPELRTMLRNRMNDDR